MNALKNIAIIFAAAIGGYVVWKAAKSVSDAAAAADRAAQGFSGGVKSISDFFMPFNVSELGADTAIVAGDVGAQGLGNQSFE